MVIWKPDSNNLLRQIVSNDPHQDSPQCESGLFWVIAEGDTYYNIAQRLNIDVNDLVTVNPTANPANLRPGQRLCLPFRESIVPPEIPPCPSGVFWVIEPGDTLYLISLATGFSIDEILAVNPSLSPDNLQPRTNICLPAS